MNTVEQGFKSELVQTSSCLLSIVRLAQIRKSRFQILESSQAVGRLAGQLLLVAARGSSPTAGPSLLLAPCPMDCISKLPSLLEIGYTYS